MQEVLSSYISEENLLSEFEKQFSNSHLSEPDSVKDHRNKAAESFKKLGIPEVKNELYKYSNIRSFLNKENYQNLTSDFQNSELENVKQYFPVFAYNQILVTQNGFLNTSLSQISETGFQLLSLKDAFSEFPDEIQKHFGKYTDLKDSMAALNSMMASEGFFLKIDKNIKNEKPILWINICSSPDPAFIQTRNLILVGEGSEIEIRRINISEGTVPVFYNMITEVHSGEQSQVAYHQIQKENDSVSMIDHLAVFQEGNSQFESSVFSIGGKFHRNNVRIIHGGSGIHTKLNGLYLPSNDEHTDNRTLIEHNFPHCESNEMYKGIAGGNAVGIFNGKVYVARDAQKTNAYQSNKNMLLSATAKLYSKPELEIYADDVKCSHGSTTGQTDKQALFYLKARGIPDAKAKQMLMLAFAKDLLDRIENEDFKQYLENLVEERFNQMSS